jgi:hypothetical protein
LYFCIECIRVMSDWINYFVCNSWCKSLRFVNRKLNRNGWQYYLLYGSILLLWYTRSKYEPHRGFTTTYAISSYHFESRSWRGVLDSTLYDKVCQWFVTGGWFSPGTAVFSANKTDITEILLKATLNTMPIHVNHPRHDTMDTQNKREHT